MMGVSFWDILHLGLDPIVFICSDLGRMGTHPQPRKSTDYGTTFSHLARVGFVVTGGYGRLGDVGVSDSGEWWAAGRLNSLGLALIPQHLIFTIDLSFSLDMFAFSWFLLDNFPGIHDLDMFSLVEISFTLSSTRCWVLICPLDSNDPVRVMTQIRLYRDPLRPRRV